MAFRDHVIGRSGGFFRDRMKTHNCAKTSSKPAPLSLGRVGRRGSNSTCAVLPRNLSRDHFYFNHPSSRFALASRMEFFIFAGNLF